MKVIIMLLTLHDSADNNNEVELPEIVHFYNRAKDGEKLSTLIIERRTVEPFSMR